MKKFFILCVALLVSALSVNAQGQQPKMTFKETEYNFGKIPNKGGEVSHTFHFTNTGTAALVITSVETSCNCTKAAFAKRPIPPGGNGEITITYDPKRQNGTFYKAIQVFTNEPTKRTIIVAQGEVVKQK